LSCDTEPEPQGGPARCDAAGPLCCAAGGQRGRAEAAWQGIDVYFDNTGGVQLELAIARINKFGRIALCGGISSCELRRRAGGWRAF
jgi:hypothetical protein